MKIVDANTKVVSSYGNIITYTEHCERIRVYLEEIKKKALQLTLSNPKLSEHIRAFKPFFWKELYIEETAGDCYYLVTLQRPHLEINFSKVPPIVEELNNKFASTGLDQDGNPTLYHDFWNILNRIRNHIVYDFIMPLFTKNMDLLILFIKEEIIVDTLKWSYINVEKKQRCYGLLFQYYEPEEGWFAVPNGAQVLIGKFADIEKEITSSKGSYANNTLIIVDIDKQVRKSKETYIALLDGKTYKKLYIWDYNSLSFLFYRNFRSLAKQIDAVLKIGIDNTYKLGELLSSSLDEQDQLIRDLRKMPTGDNEVHEALVKKILEFCFNDEFAPFHLKEQVTTENKRRRRDFRIENRNPKEGFWQHLKIKGVEQILFDAKNYGGKIKYSQIAGTVTRYLVNPAFGNFMIITSRHGINDYVELLEHYLKKQEIVLIMTDDDLIRMIHTKREGKSPTSVIEDIYHDFLDKK